MERAIVVGLGTMGSGIAQVLLQAGYQVVGVEEDAGRLNAGKERVWAGLAKAAEKGKLTPPAHEAAKAAFSVSTDLAAASTGAALVIEAVLEDLALKQHIFATCEAHALENALLATNTSSLSIGEMAAGLKRPGRFVGLHFFNPVPVMTLVEIVKGKATSDATVAAGRDLVKRLGKDAIVVKDSPGFASSRLGIILGVEAIRMVEEGVASPEDIDKAMELGYRHPMGPLKLTDLVGLDVRLAIADHLHKTIGVQFKPPELLRRMVAEGKLGKKTGQGFYSYPTGKD
jgi:3-hydroxybutyryl-CoA dehydrogenase